MSLVPVASVVALVFLPQIPGTTQGQENHDVREEPHQDVISSDTTDTNADDLCDPFDVVSVHEILL